MFVDNDFAGVMNGKRYKVKEIVKMVERETMGNKNLIIKLYVLQLHCRTCIRTKETEKDGEV